MKWVNASGTDGMSPLSFVDYLVIFSLPVTSPLPRDKRRVFVQKISTNFSELDVSTRASSLAATKSYVISRRGGVIL